MRSGVVVVISKLLDKNLCIDPLTEPRHAQALLTELSV